MFSRYAVLGDEEYGNAVPISIVDHILGAALFAVEHSNDTGGAHLRLAHLQFFRAMDGKADSTLNDIVLRNQSG